MRNLWTAAAIAGATMTAQGADAQAPGASYAPPMVQGAAPGRSVTTTTIQRRGNWQGPHAGGRMRWGQPVGGRWQGGARAPGGWAAYRRPSRGWVLPGYWFAPGFYVNDYATYGLGAPPYGYNWTRYYDDAVLVDGRGRVYDSVSGLDWDRYADDDRRPLPPIAPEHAPPPPGHGHHDGHGYVRTWVAGGSSYAAGGTIVRVEPTVTTTVTTTTTEYVDAPRHAAVRPAYRHRAPAVRSKILRRSVK